MYLGSIRSSFPNETADHSGERASSKSRRSRRSGQYWRAWLFLAAIIGTFQIWSFQHVKAYYATHLPHYDSVGSYTHAFRIINLAHSGSWREAWDLTLGFSLSPTQALFAFLLSPFLQPTPQSLQLYNTMCLALLLVSIYLAARTIGAAPGKSALAALVAFIPDTLYWWSGGLLDWQRDPSFLCLLAASFFLFFAYLGRPTLPRALGFGLTVGLTLISRDSSPPTLLSVFGGLYGVTLAVGFTRGEFKIAFKQLCLPLVATAPFFLYYVFFQLQPTIARLGNSFIAFAVGTDVWTSVQGNWTVPVSMMLGPPNELALFADPNTILYGGLGLLAVVALALGGRSGLTRKWLAVAMVAGALWVAVSTIILLTLVYGLRPLSFPAIKHAFYPVLLAPFAALFVTFVGLPTPGRPLARTVMALSWIALVAYGAESRIAAKTPLADSALAGIVPALQGIAQAGKMHTWAFLWHERVTIDVLAFYAAQRGAPLPRKLRFRGPDGSSLDAEIGLPEGVDAATISNLLHQAVVQCARYVVVSASSDQYAQTRSPLFLYRYGKQMVEELLSRYGGSTVLQFSVEGIPISVMENKAARDCPEM
jgi:hypothetical protein